MELPRENDLVTFCIIGKAEGGVKVIDQASPLILARQRSEDEDNVIVPYD